MYFATVNTSQKGTRLCNVHHSSNKKPTTDRWLHHIRILSPSYLCITARPQSNRRAEILINRHQIALDTFEEWEALWQRSAEQDSCLLSSLSHTLPWRLQWRLIWPSWEIKFQKSRWIRGVICGQQVRGISLNLANHVFFCSFFSKMYLIYYHFVFVKGISWARKVLWMVPLWSLPLKMRMFPLKSELWVLWSKWLKTWWHCSLRYWKLPNGNKHWTC